LDSYRLLARFCRGWRSPSLGLGRPWATQVERYGEQPPKPRTETHIEKTGRVPLTLRVEKSYTWAKNPSEYGVVLLFDQQVNDLARKLHGICTNRLFDSQL